MTNLKKFTGALLGLAVGDALGAPVEFQPPGSFEPITGYLSGGPFGLAAGQWTDDTSMALCLAASLVEKEGFDSQDQLERYLRWYRAGYMSSTGACFDIGTTTEAALVEFELSHQPFRSTPADPRGSNGSLMRLAPVPLVFASRPPEAISLCADSSRTTHPAQESVDACRYLGALIVGALRGEAKEALLSPHFSPVSGFWAQEQLCPVVERVASGSYQHAQPPQIRAGSLAAECLEAALWAFYRSDDFKTGCLLAVNLGDDADTAGAVYGQLAGAFYGETGIPPEWLSGLHQAELIREMGEALYNYSSRT